MRKTIDVTIIAIVRNNWRQVENCLKSLLRQPGVTTEIILLDDGSDDGAGKEIKGFAQRNTGIKLFEQKYKGLANSRNKALRQIQGRYTLFVNQDQELLPYALQLAFNEAARHNADIVQMPYMVRDAKRPRHQRLRRMPALHEPMGGGEYVKTFGGKMRIETGNHANMVKSDYLKERLVRFDHRLKDYDFDFFARAIVGAETVVVSPCPVFVTPKDRVVETAPGEDPVKTFSLEQEYLRRNFNEFADSSYLTPERVRLLRYLRCLHVLDSDPALVRQGFAPRDYNKWVKETRGYLFDFGGWRSLRRIRQRMGLKPVAVPPEKPKTPKKQNDADKTDA